PRHACPGSVRARPSGGWQLGGIACVASARALRCPAGMKKIAASVAALLLGHAARALACGCFAPPDPPAPLLPARERLPVSRAGGVVTAHVQILYSGQAKDFGWLLPLPSVPELSLGTDELFADLIAATQPQYVVAPDLSDCSRGGGGGSFCGGTSSGEGFFF